MPKGGDLALYDARRDWGTEGDARHAFYDLLRDSCMPHDQAARYAELGARRFAEQQGGRPDRPVTRRRFCVAKHGPFAGEVCELQPDGTYAPPLTRSEG
ncbi:MAG: hypothetical protein ABMA64_35895 [Myxococcota bacterium]